MEQDYSDAIIVLCLLFAVLIGIGLYAASVEAANGRRYWSPERRRVMLSVGLAALIYAGFVVIASVMDPGPALVAERSAELPLRP